MSEIKVDLKDNKGRNAMHYAIELEENESVKGTLDNVDMVELLIKVNFTCFKVCTVCYCFIPISHQTKRNQILDSQERQFVF